MKVVRKLPASPCYRLDSINLLILIGHKKYNFQSDLKCPLCSKRFLEQDDLDYHLKCHETNPDLKPHKNRNIQCEVCKRSFYDIEEFGAHVCKHFSCDECVMKFIFERNLKIHKRTHTGESVLSCDLCESLFITRYVLMYIC